MNDPQDARLGIIWLVVIILAGALFLYNTIQGYRATRNIDNAANQYSLSRVKSIRVYPQRALPVGDSIEFKEEEAFIEGFLQAFQSRHPYSPTHDTIASSAHNWFMEIVIDEKTIQIACYIPSGKGELVVGQLGKFDASGSSSYGYFYSQALYQWYQTYSHRWLTPENDRAAE